MNKHQKRERVLAIKHRQLARRRGGPTFFRAESPMGMLKNTRVGACAHCKNLTRRTDRHWQTMNPYNKNAQGLPKTEAEILEELRTEIAKRRASPLTCRSCESRRVPPCRL